VQDPSCLLDVLDKHSEPDVILRVLTCLVNVHSVVIKNSAAESQSEPQTSNMSCPHDEWPNATAASSVNSFDCEYLRRLCKKLSYLREQGNSGVQDAALRLLRLCQ